jgi:hypothetical protein
VNFNLYQVAPKKYFTLSRRFKFKAAFLGVGIELTLVEVGELDMPKAYESCRSICEAVSI